MHDDERVNNNQRSVKRKSGLDTSGCARASWLGRLRPPAMLGSLGLAMSVYGIGIQYGKQFFVGISGPKFIARVKQLGPLYLTLGAAIVLLPVLFYMLVGHFALELRFDDLLGATAGGVPGNPSIMAFASKLVATDRVDIAYVITFPAAVIMKIVVVQVMLALMR